MQALLFLLLCTETNLICYTFSEHFRSLSHINIFSVMHLQNYWGRALGR